jgi:hypothetical protein
MMPVTGVALVLAVLCSSAPCLAATTTSVPASTSSVVPQATAPSWAPLAYGDAQLGTPTAWPVVYPGSEVCGPAGAGGVVLLGPFGSSSWCGPNATAPVGQSPPANMVRLGPLPAHTGTNGPGRPSMTVHGAPVYQEVLHGRISGTVYYAPSLGVELMASGPLAARVISSLAPSVRDIVLRHPAVGAQRGPWRSMSFAGLGFAVPASWPVAQATFAFGCGLPDVAFPAPSVTLDTDSNLARLPCPYPLPARRGTNGLQIDAGSAGAPNMLPGSGLRIVVNGLQMYVDRAYPFSALVVEVDLPGRSAPVKVTIGLGTASTAGAVLRSITALTPTGPATTSAPPTTGQPTRPLRS